MLSATVSSMLLCAAFLTAGPHPLQAANVTSLTNESVKYTVGKEHFFVLCRNGVKAVIVDNSASDSRDAPGHRAGYNGVTSLSHSKRADNIFVPNYAGLNFEHIHDGTLAVNADKFEPRRAPMELRVIDAYTVELYQAPTPNWKLESCGRYELLEDGVIQYTFECIPREDIFQNGFIGLFWASYIHQPEDKSISFRGRESKEPVDTRWIKAVTPKHGVESTHPPAGELPELKLDPEFPLTLVNHRSRYVYDEPWYYGVSHGMAYVAMFSSRDRIWFAQSPTGGGAENPAWDFQWFIPNYKVGQAYGFVMRLAYIPFESREQIERATLAHRNALNS